MSEESLSRLENLLERVAIALEETAKAQPQHFTPTAPSDQADAFIWQASSFDFLPVTKVNRIPLALLKGVDLQQDALIANTKRFASGLDGQ